MALSDDIITSWLAAINRAEGEPFLPVSEDETRSGSVWGEAKQWAEAFFQAETNPFNPSNAAKHSVHLAGQDTFDLLRHEYSAQGIELKVTECSNFTHVQCRQTGSDFNAIADQKEFTDRLATTVLKTDLGIFQYPDTLAEGARFSTNPEADLYSLQDWRERADGLILGDWIIFLCYKKKGEKLGFNDDRHWFDDQFRSRPREIKSPGEASTNHDPPSTPPSETSASETQPNAANIEAAPTTSMACSSCGTMNPLGSRFCNQCGAVLGCPNCGATNAPESRFCNQCGTQLNSE